MNFTPTPTGPVVVIAPARSATTSRAVFIDGFLVGHYGSQTFTADISAVRDQHFSGKEADAHEIARRLDGRPFPAWYDLHKAVHAQERWYCYEHGESDRYGFCDICAEEPTLEAERMAEALAS